VLTCISQFVFITGAVHEWGAEENDGLKKKTVLEGCIKYRKEVCDWYSAKYTCITGFMISCKGHVALFKQKKMKGFGGET